MNYNTPQLRELLAGEYMLGTLTGAARRRFERLMLQDADLRATVAAWERRFAPLYDEIPPVTPPPRVWAQIERRIAPPGRERFWQRLSFWRPAALLAGLAVVFLTYFQLAPIAQPPARLLAVLSDKDTQPAWIVRAHDAERIDIAVLRTPPTSPDRAYELWLLPGGDAPPRSLGLLPTTGTRRVAVPPALQIQLAAGKALAVSVEPVGGSPTGLPTGPVVYQGVLVTTG